MTSEQADTPSIPATGPLTSASEHPPRDAQSIFWVRAIGAVAVIGVVLSGVLWSKLGHIQEQLARQSADTSQQAIEARAASRQAEELARETAAKLAVTDAKLGEVVLQRSQLEELMQSLTRSRDENLVVDIESAVRLAQQQAQLTGSVQPLLAALKSAKQRLSKAGYPRLAPVLRAIDRDIERIQATAVIDTPSLLLKLDELVMAVDTLPLQNAVGNAAASRTKAKPEPAPKPSWSSAISMSWWELVLDGMWEDVRNLVRVSRIDGLEASLLAPDQSFFVRENLKLRLLNARLGLLARHYEAVQSDLTQSIDDLGKYFDVQTRHGQTTLALAREVLTQTKQTEMPRVDDTLTALTTAAAGR